MAEAGESAETGKAADPLLVALGARVRAVRTEAGLSLSGVAASMGMSKGYLWKIEEGQHNTTVRQLARICVALGCTLADLVEGVAADLSPSDPRPYRWKEGRDVRSRPGRPPKEEGG